MGIEELLKTPDFEVRCDSFVSKVQKEIVPKYPDLGMDSVNFTKWCLDHQFEIDRFLDRQSAFQNEGHVRIWDLSKRVTATRVSRAVKDVKNLAESLGGSEAQGLEDLRARKQPFAYLIFIFR